MRLQLLNILTGIFLCSCVTPKQKPAPLPAEGIAQYYNESNWPFYHGVASGDPLTDKVIIWTRVTPKDPLENIAVAWEVATDKGFESMVASGKVNTNPEMDYTVKVDVDQLKEATKYFYRFKALDHISTVGLTKTINQSADSLNLAVVSCSNYEFGYFNSYRLLSELESVDAVLHLGDYIYEYAPGGYGDSTTGRFHFPENELITLEDYRLRYSQYRLDPDLQAAHQKFPFIAIWDDHEIANNSYKDGAQNHQAEEGDYEERKAAAKKAYYEWLPVRESKELYRSFNYGNLADLIMLDERLAGRTAPADSVGDPSLQGEDRSMLGKQQMNWLKQQLEASDATWKVIGNQVIFSYLNWGRPSFNINLDSWDGYPRERQQLKELITESSIENIIFVTGDTHSSWAFEVTENPFNNYNPKTGQGAFAVEFGTTSINSGNSDESFPTDSVKRHEEKIVNTPINPHLKFANLRDHGFMLLSLSADNAAARWYYVNTLKERTTAHTIKGPITVKEGDKKLNMK